MQTLSIHLKLLLILLLDVLSSFAQNNHFKIIGELPEDVEVDIWLLINTDTLITRTSNKQFVFEGNLEYPVQVLLKSSNSLCGSRFYLEPATIFLKTVISRNANGICIFKGKVAGSASESIYERFALKREEILKSTSNINLKHSKLKELVSNTIQANPDFIFSAHLLQQYAKAYEADWLKEQYEVLSERIKSTSEALALRKLIEQAGVLKPGNLIPEMVLPDVEGKSFSFQSLKGKIFLIDFWASWCVPCRKEIPELIKIYKTFKSQGLEIVAVSLDTDYYKWKEAIVSDSGSWIQVCDLQAWNSEIVKHFYLQSIPFNILIDQNGRIVASDLKKGDLEKSIKMLLRR